MPTDIQLAAPDPTDSPYAGLLFWQGGLLSVNSRITDFSSILFGMLGPASLAEESQNIVHKITGADIPQGWDHQLDNEAVIEINYGRFLRLSDWTLGNLEFDTVVGANGFLGNLLTAAVSVCYMRIGKRLESSYPMFALASNREINPTAYSGGWFAYVGIGVQYTFQDLLFERHTSRKSTTITPDRYSESLSIGVAISKGKWGFSVNFTEGGLLGNQGSESLQFGSFTILRKLN